MGDAAVASIPADLRTLLGYQPDSQFVSVDAVGETALVEGFTPKMYARRHLSAKAIESAGHDQSDKRRKKKKKKRKATALSAASIPLKEVNFGGTTIVEAAKVWCSATS